MSELKRTPLRDFHAAHGARLVDFAGWEMPVQYRSILEEHKAVRRTAGLFDVSHMGEVDVRGADAGKFLNRLVTNDVAKLFPGRVLYSPMCYPNGGVVDDLLVYMRGTGDYFLCINAGNTWRGFASRRAGSTSPSRIEALTMRCSLCRVRAPLPSCSHSPAPSSAW
jgi:aminomethyltransferase